VGHAGITCHADGAVHGSICARAAVAATATIAPRTCSDPIMML
jgi:hypothetical protein